MKIFDGGVEYFWQYDKETERYLAVFVCDEKYDFEGLKDHKIKYIKLKT